jgi:hypothetical protein
VVAHEHVTCLQLGKYGIAAIRQSRALMAAFAMSGQVYGDGGMADLL